MFTGLSSKISSGFVILLLSFSKLRLRSLLACPFFFFLSMCVGALFSPTLMPYAITLLTAFALFSAAFFAADWGRLDYSLLIPAFVAFPIGLCGYNPITYSLIFFTVNSLVLALKCFSFSARLFRPITNACAVFFAFLGFWILV